MTSEERIEAIKEAQKKYYPGRKVWNRKTGEEEVVLYPFIDAYHRLCLRTVGWKDLVGTKNWTTIPPLPDGEYLLSGYDVPVYLLLCKKGDKFYRRVRPGGPVMETYNVPQWTSYVDGRALYRIVPDGDTVKFEKVELPEEGE